MVRCDVCGGSPGDSEGNETHIFNEVCQEDIRSLIRNMEVANVEKLEESDLSQFVEGWQDVEELYFAANSDDNVLNDNSRPGDEEPVAECEGLHGMWQEDHLWV